MYINQKKSPSIFVMNKALFIFKEGAYKQVCDRFKNKLQRRSWQKDAGDSEATLTKDGKLTLTTKMPSLKGETFNVECGIDKETKLPYVGASIAYEFYEYKMNTAIGECTLTGTCTFKNTFKPELENNMCHLYIPAYRLAEKALPIVQGAAIAGGLLIAAPTAGATVGGALISGGKLLPVLAVAGGGLISSSVFAGDKNYKHKKIQSYDNKLVITFKSFKCEETK